MNILMLLEREFPQDDRVEKEALSLVNEGHKVILATYTFAGRQLFENYKGIKLYRKPISKYMFKFSALALIFPFYFKFWGRYIRSILKMENINAIHVHDLPLSKVAYKICRKNNFAFICDQHEYYSNWIVHTAHHNTTLGKIVKFFSNWKKYEKKYLKKADLVITVEEPLRQLYLKHTGINPNNIILVPNTPSTNVFNMNNIEPEIVEKYRNNFVLFYAGGIDVLRGIDTIIEALPALKVEIPNIKFVMAGALRKNYDPFKKAELLGVSGLIEFVGWLPIEKLPSYIQACNIGVFTPQPNRDEIHNTIATKIYQYAIMGKPILTSKVRMMQEFVECNGLGFAIDSVDDFIEKTLELKNNKDLYRKFCENGINAGNMSTWEGTIQIMLEKYRILGLRF